MQIKDLFLKPIDRRINGVIKVGQNQEEDKNRNWKNTSSRRN